MEHKSLFYSLDYPTPPISLDETPSAHLDAAMNEALAEGWVPYAAVTGEDLTGYILMTRRSDEIGLFGRRPT